MTEDGSVSQQKLEHDLFLHRNAPDQDIDGKSPSEVVYGHNLEEHMPLDPLSNKHFNPRKPLKLVPDFTN